MPQPMRSPVSPYRHQVKQSFSSQRPYYPLTPQPESARNRGLGIFACSLPQQQSTVQQQLPPSPQPSDGWSHPSIMEQDFPQSSQPPDIFSAAYDPFSGFSASPNTGMMSGSSPEAPGLVYCQTPPSTNLPSHRSSVSSSYAPSEPYSQHSSDFAYRPRVKVEDPSEWHPAAGNEYGLQRSMTTQCLSPYSTGVSPATAAGDDVYRHANWPKPSAVAYPVGLHNHEDYQRAQMETAHVLPSVNRIKKKRQRTTPEEATHECRVCGKLFKRSYNWKSHMETHNPDRKYPHPCTVMVGDTRCTKKFQRKTDLDRHYDSVHLKARNHKCDLCGNKFARRDTLRRHTEDGCPKRFEVGFREGSAMTPGRWPLTRSYSSGIPQPSAISAIPSSGSAEIYPAYSRPEFVGT
ncbi:MAG: hypothetical protein Q9196_005635, partial [Gyalolechia fulgens]